MEALRDSFQIVVSSLGDAATAAGAAAWAAETIEAKNQTGDASCRRC
jgi:hypothetical protein